MSETPAILGPDGQPVARKAVSKACPNCGAGPEKRVLSGGFGEVHDVCSRCGYEWETRSL
jgi:uncharacterized protein (DUF983 family)